MTSKGSTVACIYHGHLSGILEMTLKGGIIALYPYHGHLPGFQKTHHNVCTVSKHSSLTDLALPLLPFSRINQNSLEVFWQQFQIYAPPCLFTIRLIRYLLLSSFHLIRFFLERTSSGVDLLEMALKTALWHSISSTVTGLYKTHNNNKLAKAALAYRRNE